MNDLDLCLEVVSRSRRRLRYVFFAAYSRLSRDFRGGGVLAKFSWMATG